MAENKALYKTAQRGLIASLLFDGTKAIRVLELTSADDFIEPSLALIMHAITEVARRDDPVSATTVAQQLEVTGELAQVGGLSELYKLHAAGEKALLEAQPEIYAALVRESSAKYAISGALVESGASFKDDSGFSAVEGISILQSKLSEEMLRLADDATLTDAGAYVDSYFDLLKERERIGEKNKEEAQGLQGIPTPLPSLNRHTAGFMPEQLITVGAKTGIGKSVFAIMSTVAAGRAGKTVMLFSLEMDRDSLMDRILSNMSGVSLRKLKVGIISDEEEAALRRATEELSKMNIIIDTDAKATVDSIRSKAMRQQQSAEGLDMIILDYLQLVTSSGRFSNRQELVADLSRNMKLMAKTLGVPVMILSQLNKGRHDDEENALPTLENIRESGAIAHDSDIVILLHRDISPDHTTPNTIVILAKNRSGESNKHVRCHSNLDNSNLREIVESKNLSDDLTDDEHDDLNSLTGEFEFDVDDDIDLDVEGL